MSLSEQELLEMEKRAADWGLDSGYIRNDVEQLTYEYRQLQEKLQEELERQKKQEETKKDQKR